MVFLLCPHTAVEFVRELLLDLSVELPLVSQVGLAPYHLVFVSRGAVQFEFSLLDADLAVLLLLEELRHCFRRDDYDVRGLHGLLVVVVGLDLLQLPLGEILLGYDLSVFEFALNQVSAHLTWEVTSLKEVADG